MSRDVKIEGLDKIAKALGQLGEEVQAEVAKDLQRSGVAMKGEITKGYNRGPATGHPRPLARSDGQNRSAGSRASAPGEAPMTDTGTLAAATTFRESIGNKLSVEIENRAKSDGVYYGSVLEFGWGREDQARPLWRPVRDAEEPKLWKRVEKTVAEGVKKRNRR